MSPQNRAKLLKTTSIASISVAIILIIVKTWAGLSTNSISIIASLIDSFTDLLASGINFIGIYIALKPIDKNHNFGHAKAESISSLLQAIFIFTSALFLFYNAIKRMIHPAELLESEFGIKVMLFSILLSVLLTLYQRYVIKKTGSLSLKADSLHYVSDILLNASIILALYLVQLGFSKADLILALILSVWMLYIAIKILRNSLVILMDETLPIAEIETIKNSILNIAEVKAYHELYSRFDGYTRYVQVHIEIDESVTFNQSHHIVKQVIDAIKAHFPQEIKVFVHTDPIKTNNLN